MVSGIFVCTPGTTEQRYPRFKIKERVRRVGNLNYVEYYQAAEHHRANTEKYSH